MDVNERRALIALMVLALVLGAAFAIVVLLLFLFRGAEFTVLMLLVVVILIYGSVCAVKLMRAVKKKRKEVTE